MSRKSTRKLPKPQNLQVEPNHYRQLYVKKHWWNEISIIVASAIMFVAGIRIYLQLNSVVFFAYQILSWGMMLLMVFLGVFLILGLILGQLESVVISGESLIFSYRLTKKIYKASEVAAIGWQTSVYWRSTRYGGNPYGEYTYMSVTMKNGKKEQIPGSPYSHFDIEKPLRAWLERYNPPDDENAENTA